MLKRLSLATTPAVSLLRAKQRLRVDDDDNNDDIEALIAAATEVFERSTGRVLQPSDWEYRFDGWGHAFGVVRPSDWDHKFGGWHRFIAIPLAPVRDVTGVSYLDLDGVENIIAPSSESWRWERTSEGAVVIFARNYQFPAISFDPQSVRVQFSAGYDDPALSGSGDDADLVLPKAAETAILFLVSTWNENRESVTSAKVPLAVPQTFDLLVDGLRIIR